MRTYLLEPEAVHRAPQIEQERLWDWIRKQGFDPDEIKTIRLIPKTKTMVFEVYMRGANKEKLVRPGTQGKNAEAWTEEVSRPMTEKPPFVDLTKIEDLLL